MKNFFRFFPTASIVVAGWDRQESFIPIKKKWSDWSLPELREHNLVHRRPIYFTPCDMKAPAHTKENWAGVRAWYCDIDVCKRDEVVSVEEREQRKTEVLGRLWMCDVLYNLPQPSFIVDTRNGFHVYWLAWHEKPLDDKYMPENGLYRPSRETFDKIERYIVKTVGGDEKACKDVQLMRLPGFYNWKDERGYPCRLLPQLSTMQEYCEEHFLKRIPVEEDRSEKAQRALEKFIISIPRKSTDGLEDIFKTAQDMSQLLALAKFSGTEYVNGENYHFQKTKGDKYNILINGKGCASFVDTAKNCIFCPSGTKGSPNIIEWLKWYRSYENWELARILKKILL